MDSERSRAAVATVERRYAVRVPEVGSRTRTAFDFLFVAPLVLLVGVLILYPAVVGVYRSFFTWTPAGGATEFVGFDNYVTLAKSPVFHEILKNEAIYLIGVPIWTILPLGIALALQERVLFPGLFRTLFFFPAVLSPALVGILFRSMLRPDGMVNETLDAMGLGALAQSWLDDPSLVKPVMIGILAWAGLGTGVLIFSAGLAAVPPELFEAAEVDGASWFQRLRYIMIPSLLPLIEFWVVYQIISVFLWIFGWIYVLTQGGPRYSSTTLDYDVYTNAMNFGQFGLAAAEAVYLLGLVLIVITAGVMLRRLRGGATA